MSKLLLMKLSSLGDVVHTFPAVSDLKRYRPDVEVIWAVEEDFVDLVKLHSGVDRVIPVPLRRLRRSNRFWYLSKTWRVFIDELGAVRCDIALDLQGLLKSAWLMRKVQSFEYVGGNRKSVRESLASCFYSRCFSVRTSRHAVKRNRYLMAQALDYMHEWQDDAPNFALRKEKSRILSKNLILIQGSAWKSKLLPQELWQKLIDKAVADDWHLTILAGCEEENKRALSLQDGRAGIDVVYRASFADLVTLFSQAGAAISLDTGLGHLAGALAVPIVGVFAATDHRKTGILGRYARNLQCAPACMRRDCRLHGADKSNACMHRADADMIWQTVLQLHSAAKR